MIVQSDTAPELHIAMGIATVSANAEVVGTPVTASVDSMTTMSMLSRADIQSTPGADRTDSMAMITDNVPGAYMVHDMLHIRGGHQFSGSSTACPFPTPISPTTSGRRSIPRISTTSKCNGAATTPNMATGPMAFSTRSRAPASSATRSANWWLSFGNYDQTNDQINCGGHTQRFAYYGSLNGNRTNLGLETPVAANHTRRRERLRRICVLIFNVDREEPVALDRFPAPGLLPDSQSADRGHQPAIYQRSRNRGGHAVRRGAGRHPDGNRTPC